MNLQIAQLFADPADNRHRGGFGRMYPVGDTIRKINGISVYDDAVWSSLLNVLAAIDSSRQSQYPLRPSIEQITSDNELTEEEIDDFLDMDGDHSLEVGDFESYSTQIFTDLAALLDRYYYRLSYRIQDFNDQASNGALPDMFLSNRDIAARAAALNPIILFLRLPAGFLYDRDFLLDVLKQNSEVFRYIPEEFQEDRDFVLQAAARNGLVLQYLSPDFQGDREVVATAVENNGRVFMYASAALRENSEFALEMCKKNYEALSGASDSLRNDREFVSECLRNDWRSFQYASCDLQRDREFIFEMLSRGINCRLVQYADESIRSDQEVMLEAIKKDAYAFTYASDDLQNNRDFVLSAVRINGLAVRYASKFEDDHEIALEAVKQNARALPETRFLYDGEILAHALLRGNESTRYYLHDSDEDEVWPIVTSLLAEEGYPMPAGVDSFDRLYGFFEEDLDIDYVRTMHSLTDIFTVYQNRIHFTDDTRPIALLIFTKNDTIGVFDAGRIINAFVGSGHYYTLYYEARNEDEVIKIMEGVQNEYHRPVDLLFLAGHGSRTALSLADQGPDENETLEIDNSDFDPPPDGNNFGDLLASLMDPNGQIFLDSCSNGEGGETGDNLANHVAQSVPQGVTITSYTVPTRVVGLSVDSDGQVSITLDNNGPMYITRGRRELL
jgi:hypothetical protein